MSNELLKLYNHIDDLKSDITVKQEAIELLKKQKEALSVQITALEKELMMLRCIPRLAESYD